MKTVCVCSSFKFYKEQVQLRKLFKAYRVKALLPYPDEAFWIRKGDKLTLRNLGKYSRSKGVQIAGRVSRKHLRKIDRADIVYVISKRGYVGKGVCMEIGYAKAKNKQIFSTEPIDDWPVASMISKVENPDEFLKMFK
ncbi:MAG: hypothetical protein ABIE03_02815 [Patescibacteria group bacterium]|nr:hypothetical protein [Patescibacteria group bacterium]